MLAALEDVTSQQLDHGRPVVGGVVPGRANDAPAHPLQGVVTNAVALKRVARAVPLVEVEFEVDQFVEPPLWAISAASRYSVRMNATTAARSSALQSVP